MASSTLTCVLCLSLAATPAAAQSLGQLASEEAARRKALRAPARVITGDDLGEPVIPVSPQSEAPAQDAAVAEADAPAAPRVAVSPAKRTGGSLPLIPVQAVSGGEVVLEVSVSRDGRVTAVKPLRHTAPFTDAMVAAVRTWTFTPALDAPVPAAGALPDPTEHRPMASTVLVLGVFRPPSLFPGTLGEPPKAVATPSGGAPALASALEMPVYPMNALNDGVVLLELNVAAHGGVGGIGVVRSASPFDKPAIDAASALGFAPAKVHGKPAAAHVYVVAAFRQPIT
jgi:TonB family protein